MLEKSFFYKKHTSRIPAFHKYLSRKLAICLNTECVLTKKASSMINNLLANMTIHENRLAL